MSDKRSIKVPNGAYTLARIFAAKNDIRLESAFAVMVSYAMNHEKDLTAYLALVLRGNEGGPSRQNQKRRKTK